MLLLTHRGLIYCLCSSLNYCMNSAFEQKHIQEFLVTIKKIIKGTDSPKCIINKCNV